jgi:hypothetical protein
MIASTSSCRSTCPVAGSDPTAQRLIAIWNPRYREPGSFQRVTFTPTEPDRVSPRSGAYRPPSASSQSGQVWTASSFRCRRARLGAELEAALADHPLPTRRRCSVASGSQFSSSNAGSRRRGDCSWISLACSRAQCPTCVWNDRSSPSKNSLPADLAVTGRDAADRDRDLLAGLVALRHVQRQPAALRDVAGDELARHQATSGPSGAELLELVAQLVDLLGHGANRAVLLGQRVRHDVSDLAMGESGMRCSPTRLRSLSASVMPSAQRHVPDAMKPVERSAGGPSCSW